VLRSLVRECAESKPLASAACRVEFMTRRSGGMADAADSKSKSRVFVGGCVLLRNNFLAQFRPASSG
jgi:hypothetical protein